MLKVVFSFNQHQAGWTETHYFDASDPYVFANTFPDTTILQMLSFRAVGTELFSIRASVADGPKKSYLRLLRVPAPTPTVFNDYNKPDVVQTSLVMRITAANGHARQFTLRGLLDGDVVRDPRTGGSSPSPVLSVAVDRLLSQLINLGARIRSTGRLPSELVTQTRVSLVAPNALTATVSELSVDDDVIGVNPLPQYVSILGIPRDDLPGFPALVQVVGKLAGPPIRYQIPYRYRASTPSVGPPKMRLMLYKTIFSPYVNWIPLRFSERKTGRPFGLSRGRAPAFVKRQ